MAVSGVSNYRDVIYQWQNQQLKNTGSGNSGQSSGISQLFGSSSITSQISSMIELTKYAMNAMGLSSDSRVTFSQISKYREQLQSEFNQGVKDGLANSGIKDLSGLSFTLDSDGKLTATGGGESDRKKAQAWLDANPSYGQELRESLENGGIDSGLEVNFRLSNNGKISIIDYTSENIQAALDKNEDLTKNLRRALDEIGVSSTTMVEFTFDENGELKVKEGTPKADAINEWLANNPGLADAVKTQLKKKDIDTSAVSLRLGGEGNVQINVNNAENNDIQAIMDKNSDLGQKIAAGLNSLGIDKNASFMLQINDDGGINIISDHPDRDKIQLFFEENPELVKKYRQIEALAGIDDARKAMQISPTEMRKRIQIESMACWWAGSGNSNSYFGNYSDSGFSLLSGLNLNV